MTRTDRTGPVDTHRDCWELLPWIANERAASTDVARIEPHLRGCRACQEELAAQRRLRETIRSEEAVVLAPQTSLQKVMQRIEGSKEPDQDAAFEAPVAEARAAASAASRRSPTRLHRWLPTAAAIQAVAIAGLLGAIGWQSREEITLPRYTTLTTNPTVAIGPVIRVVFTGDIPLHEMSGLVRSIDAQIVAGPSDAGVYTLALAAGATGSIDSEQAVALLRRDRRVLFAELAMTHSGTQ